jgi:alkyldihydroxyacetonephosphate synthase
VRTGGRGPRSATGPDLNQLFVGSEGTLGVITEGRFRVHRVPTYTGQRAFGFRSFADGLDGCRRILRRGATPAVLRLYDETESGRSFDQGSTNVLIVLDEGDPGLVDATLAVVDQESAAADKLEPNLVDRWMEQRNDVSALAPLWRHGIVVDTVEVSARWSVLPGLYRSVLDALHGVDGTLAASSHQSHAYTDGACLYFTFAGRPPSSVGGAPVAGVAGGSGSVGGGAVGTVDGTSVPELDGDAPALDDEQQAWAEHYYEEAWNKVTAATRDAGGAISHHHGIGINRARFLPDALGSAFGVLTTVKQALDPKGILNPGKLGLPNPFGPATWP